MPSRAGRAPWEPPRGSPGADIPEIRSACPLLLPSSRIQVKRLHLGLLPVHPLLLQLGNGAEHPIIVEGQDLLEERQIVVQLGQDLHSPLGASKGHVLLENVKPVEINIPDFLKNPRR